MWSFFAFCFFVASVSCHTVQYSETFPDASSINNWVHSKHKGDEQGIFIISAGNSPVDSVEDLGLQTSQDARFYGITTKINNPFSNKDKTLVLQFTVKYGPKAECGGAYIKLLGSDVDQEKFHGETPYKIMFGPDKCGSMRKVHVIMNYKGKNYPTKKEIEFKNDDNTHLYTLIITPDNKYEVKIDNAVVEKGAFEDDFDFLPPKKIKDATDKKPSDWVDEEYIDDPDSKKPDDWDQPKTIPDEKAKKPDDWDDEMDGKWEAPEISNPAYKGEWKPTQIKNPAFKGRWIQKEIDNPDYYDDPLIYVHDDIGVIGFDLWQVQSGSVFDNILVTDSVEFAEKEGERLWKKRYDAEVAASKTTEKQEAADEDLNVGDAPDAKEETHDEL